MLQSSEIERVLVATAHPDDVDFMSAGTIANLTDDGVEVVYCLVTDGQAGGFDKSISRVEMGDIRRREQTNAAAEVGVTSLHFLGYMDGMVEVSLNLRHDISHVIRQVRPQVVIAQSPLRTLESTYGSHPDHTATGEATMCAVYPDARNEFAFPGEPCADLEPWEVEEVWIPFGPGTEDNCDGVIDITDQVERKIRALQCHESQHREPDAMTEMVREWFQRNGEANGLSPGRSAEIYRVIDTR